MNWRKSGGGPHHARPGYHHGNLKEALIAAARKLIAEHGPLGFTLNEASKQAGVSPSAPYRHFRDRNALIEATAEEGYKLLRERLEASTAGIADPYTAICRMGPAYYAFSLDEPGLYQAMFSAGLPPAGAPVAEASAKAFGVLYGIVEKLGAGQGESRKLALKIWAFSHGMSGLIASGAVSIIDAGELSRNAIDAFLRDAGVSIPHNRTTGS